MSIPAVPIVPAHLCESAALRTDVPASILIIHPEAAVRQQLLDVLQRHHALVEAVASPEAAEALRQRCHFDLFIVAMTQPGVSGLEWLKLLQAQGVRADVIFTAERVDPELSVSVLRAGARDLLISPFSTEQIQASVQRCLKQRELLRENFLSRPQAQRQQPLNGIVGQSEAMRELAAVVERIATTNSTVLIEGETGTGKELVTRAIHQASGRSGAFVAVNCGSISPDLLESELFGHTRGAFTGAQAARDGLFVHAKDGTLFLDEIGEMPLPMQAKLLRVLEQKTVRPVGSDREVPVDCRVIAATNRSLPELVQCGAFREDLFYRLNVVTLRVPPLRERTEDIPLLAHYFSEKISANLGVAPLPFNHHDITLMQQYDWPGNVREFRNVIERSLLLGKLPGDCCGGGSGRRTETQTEASVECEGDYPLHWSLAEVEKQHMQRVLASVGGNKSEAARRLGVSRKTLERKASSWSEAVQSSD
jgi:two-component system NtrC family response regulator